MTAAVTVEAVTVQYGHRKALDQVSLTVDTGCMLALTGASGAGKTSLLWTIAGLRKPDTGSVSIAEDMRVHLIPQGNGLASVLTAGENSVAALLAAGIEAGEAANRTQSALRKLGLAAQTQQLVEELSGGQRQRVAVARGLAMRAKVLLADEVTSDLDPENRDRVLELLRQQAANGAAVIFATNDIEAANGCDKRIDLSDGRIELTKMAG